MDKHTITACCFRVQNPHFKLMTLKTDDNWGGLFILFWVCWRFYLVVLHFCQKKPNTTHKCSQPAKYCKGTTEGTAKLYTRRQDLHNVISLRKKKVHKAVPNVTPCWGDWERSALFVAGSHWKGLGHSSVDRRTSWLPTPAPAHPGRQRCPLALSGFVTLTFLSDSQIIKSS